MIRSRSPLLVGALFISLVIANVSADPPGDDHNRKLNTLAVQQAMGAARQHLRDSHPKQAVELLEDQLARAGGQQAFLELLRDAYRDYIMKLSLDHEMALAQRYVQRLAILDPQAARALTIPTAEKPVKFEVRPTPTAPPTPLPNFAASHEAKPPAVTATTTGAKPITARGKIEELGEDPFGLSNQRLPSSLDAGQLATQLLARANDEFTQRRYKEARYYYEQAFQADQHATDACRDSWAYCMLSDVVESLNRPGLGGKALPELKKDVHGAIAMAPKLASTADWLLREIDQRKPTEATAAPAAVGEVTVAMQHFGRNPQGWQVTDTPHFRIYHNQARDLVERVARIAERTHRDMSRKWFGSDGADWHAKCELVLHANAADYCRSNPNVPASSPGHASIEHDPVTRRVVGRRLDMRMDHAGTLETVLPHETTHCVIAGQFGPFQVPRWVDEGMAVLSEPAEKVDQHRRNLFKAARAGQMFSVKELMQLDNYPQPQRVSAFYAQSVMLVEFLTQQQGPVVFSAFVKDGMRTGWEATLQKHYHWSLGELQQRWDAHILGAGQRLAAGSR